MTRNSPKAKTTTKSFGPNRVVKVIETYIPGQNETQKNIFRSLVNRTKTKEELAEICGCSVKTISNNLPPLERLLNKDGTYFLIKNFNSTKDLVLSICEKKEFTAKIKPKIFKWTKSEDFPYLIINLPPPPKDNKWIVIPLGDIHLGADSCDIEALTGWVKWIEENENVLVILNGDLIENASKESPGSSVFRQLFPPQEQKERFISLLAPIAHRILYSVKGNHGNRSVKQVFLDPEKDISDALEVEYFEGACFADIVCQGYKWEFMSIHGSGGASSISARLNKVFKKNQFHSAQIFTVGHTHDIQSTRDYEIVRDQVNRTLILKKRYYVICGTLQSYWGSYASEWVLPPTKVGLPKIELSCDKSEKPGDYHVIT